MLADAPKQRLALSDTVEKLGLALVDAVAANQLEEVGLGLVWLVDVDDYNESLQETIANSQPKCVVLGFSPAPHIKDVKFERWQKLLIRRLSHLLKIQTLEPQKNDVSKAPWRSVLFLGASMGGPDALKAFLDKLSPSLPVAIVIAHHFDGQMLHELPKVLTRHNDWRCRLVETTQPLQTGVCLIAPVDKQIVCDSTGRVILTKKPWEGEYRPNIGRLLKNLSDVFGAQLIAIIFSGMGDDGSQFAKEILVNHSFLWAQDPKTCQSPSQPQAFIDTGVCQFVGTPEALAQRVNRLFCHIERA